MDDARKDIAVDFVTGGLDPIESDQFFRRLKEDPELAAFVRDLEDTAAQIAHAAPLHRPPPSVKQDLMARIGGKPEVETNRAEGAWIPWAMAAALAVASVFLWQDRVDRGTRLAAAERENERSIKEGRELGRRLADLQAERAREVAGIRQELATLKERDALATMKIATLSAKVEAYANALAVVIWDPETQTGLVKLDQFPALDIGRDYQLWVIDPAKPTPVSAGVVPVSSDGIARVEFKPEQRVGGDETFAISIEKKGGSATPQGDIVVVGK
ncbi:MAG: anti-sigma factor [Chthoniobacteraceae bacterium]